MLKHRWHHPERRHSQTNPKSAIRNSQSATLPSGRRVRGIHPAVLPAAFEGGEDEVDAVGAILHRWEVGVERTRFFAGCARQTGRAGDCVIFNGMCWHCAMPNESDHDRSGVLIEYLPKFVTPLEDQQAGVRQEVIDRATPLMRQLMSLEYPYPKLFDEAAASVQIGVDLDE